MAKETKETFKRLVRQDFWYGFYGAVFVEYLAAFIRGSRKLPEFLTQKYASFMIIYSFGLMATGFR